MELTRKQIILIAAVSGLILLLTVGAVLILDAREEEALPEPTVSPQATATPLPTPPPTPAPSPTDFRLPLVPRWDTPRPTADMAGAFVPQSRAAIQTELPGGGSEPLAENSGGDAQDILAVGLREGRAAALLLLRLTDGGLTITSLPPDGTLLSGSDLKAQGVQAASLAEAATGRRWGAWMALDLACLPAVLEITGPLGDFDPDASSVQDALSLAVGAAACIERVSLLKFPALKRAVGEGFASSLSPRELWSLFWTIRRGVAVRAFLQPTEKTARVPKNFFGESS